MSEKQKALNNESNKIIYSSIIANTKINDNGLQIIATEFGEQKIFVNSAKGMKKPIKANQKTFAKPNNKNTWSTFNQALEGTKKYKNYLIGIMFAKTLKGSLCGLDIDNCIINGVIQPEAMKIVRTFNTYTEISQSGTGLHLIFYAKKKGKKCVNSNLEWCGKLELYDNGRHFALTGNVINDIGIMERQKECDLLYDKYLKILDSNNNENAVFDEHVYTDEQIAGYMQDVEKLLENSKNIILKENWNGKRSKRKADGSPDDSRNDYDLFSGLAWFYPRKPYLIEQLALKSPYCKQMKPERFQEKWIKRRDNYLIPTIENAIKDIESKRKGGK